MTTAQAALAPPSTLRAAMRAARIEAAERTAVVVDLREAEAARLDILNEALAPVFADVPAGVDLFDRAVVPGDPPRLWIDMVAHVVMGRDKRLYRFVQDTRYGRRILAESPEVAEIVKAVTLYVARRLVERERALAGDVAPLLADGYMPDRARRRRRLRGLAVFAFGMMAGVIALLAAAWFLDPLVY